MKIKIAQYQLSSKFKIRLRNQNIFAHFFPWIHLHTRVFRGTWTFITKYDCYTLNIIVIWLQDFWRTCHAYLNCYWLKAAQPSSPKRWKRNYKFLLINSFVFYIFENVIGSTRYCWFRIMILFYLLHLPIVKGSIGQYIELY